MACTACKRRAPAHRVCSETRLEDTRNKQTLRQSLTIRLPNPNFATRRSPHSPRQRITPRFHVEAAQPAAACASGELGTVWRSWGPLPRPASAAVHTWRHRPDKPGSPPADRRSRRALAIFAARAARGRASGSDVAARARGGADGVFLENTLTVPWLALSQPPAPLVIHRLSVACASRRASHVWNLRRNSGLTINYAGMQTYPQSNRLRSSPRLYRLG